MKPPETINWGIIGCGNVTEVKSGPAFNKVPHSKLEAVMRRNAEKARDYAKRHHVSKWYSNADDLINDPQVNAIYVATPPLYHEEYSIRALKAGKPVYLEKPMSVDAVSAQRIADTAMHTGVKLSIAHYRRQQNLFLRIKRLLEDETIGKIRIVNLRLFQPHQSKMIAETEENWRVNTKISGGGLFHDLAPHQLDLMLYFFGNAKKVSGMSVNRSGLYDADDTVSGQILFQNDILFNGSWCFTVPPDQREDHCEIIGSKGTIRFSIFEDFRIYVTTDEKKKVTHFDKLPHVQQPMIQKVVEYFLDQAPNPCSAEEGVEVMKWIDSFTKIDDR